MTPQESLHHAAALMLHLDADEVQAVLRTLSPEESQVLTLAVAQARAEAPKTPKSADEISVKFTPVSKPNSQLVTDPGHYVRSFLRLALQPGAATPSVHPAGAPVQPQAARASAVALAPKLPVQPQPPQQPLVRPSGVERLRLLAPAAIAALLAQEHPQVAAAALAHLGADLAARVLQDIAPAHQQEIAQRIAGLGAPKPSAWQDLDDAMAHAVARHLGEVAA